MRIISQNVTNYGIEVPKDTIFRINLAWCNSIDELKAMLQKHRDNKIFLDLPIKRIKTPNNRYTLDDLIPIILSHKQNITLVPKIESPIAIKNISDIVNALPTKERILMLDHDDLFSAILKNNEPTDVFKKYVQQLVDYCNSNKITLLRTIGVMFSDEEKRISEYIK